VNPLLFYKPYYMEVGKGGDKAYALLREALESSEKIAIAKVVIKVRQHLAAIKPQEKGLMLELMHFPDEIRDVSEFKAPATKAISKPEMKMALQLIESMSEKWNPEEYKDDYRDALEKMIEQKIETGEAGPAPKKKKPTGNIIDLASVLQRSIQEVKKGGAGKAREDHARAVVKHAATAGARHASTRKKTTKKTAHAPHRKAA
jgi:DNA end-binding protein Ku